jgi:oligopeptide transport system ATP-binding protein
VSPKVEVRGLAVHYPLPRGVADVLARRPPASVHAVDGVDLRIASGETLGLVGESGCGKSTLGRALLGLLRPTAGEVRFDGVPIATLRGERLRAFRQKAQMIFQDPFSSLNPRLSVGSALAEVLKVHRRVEPGREAEAVAEWMRRVGLRPEDAPKRPSAFSGGERQRVVIARALMLEPEFVVADEPVSALDVSVQAQVLNLLRRLKDEMGLTMVFISHDLGVVRYIADRVAVMYLGRIVEIGARRQVFTAPRHPYTSALLQSVPHLDGRPLGAALGGDPPSPVHVPRGCRFASRCPYAAARCREEDPPLREVEAGHWAACHFAEALGAQAAARVAPN